MISHKLLKPTKQFHILTRLLSEPSNFQWEASVGLEIHAQIQCNSKLFSGAGTQFTASINNRVSLFDAAIPGTLPVLNKECVEKCISTALALNCEIHETSWFDRKHYFYADLPAGYQITQQRFPLATNGSLEFNCYQSINRDKPYLKRTRIKQIQLEQDSGKFLHDSYSNQSLVDLNRAGNPLMEIVFEPDLKNGDEAACLVKELMMIFKALATCSCKIEEGALRVDANISVKPKGSAVLGIRTEIKNIGGLSNVLKAVNFEITRQIRMRKFGKQIINETRAWDATRNMTLAMRDKEVEQDYRFMIDPNLLPLRVTLDENDSRKDFINVSRLRNQLPELPVVYRAILSSTYNLPSATILRLLVEPKLLAFFLATMEDNRERNAVKICNLLFCDVLSAIYKISINVDECKMDPKHFGELYDLLIEQIINRVIFRHILDMVINGSEKSPRQIVEQENLYQINDESILEESCRLTIEFNPDEVESYHRCKKAKKLKHFQQLYNEALKHTHGRANLLQLKKIIANLLNSSIKNNDKT